MEQRYCNKCNKLLFISEFRVDRKYITYTCKPCYFSYLKQYRSINKTKIANQKAAWHQLNKQEVLNNRKNNIELKLANALRVRLNQAIKKDQKFGSAVKDLGCSIEELKVYLESKFKPGMNWSNWGRGNNKWHIDHIKPLSSFELNDPIQYKLACNYLNLQPLWETDNLSKGAKC